MARTRAEHKAYGRGYHAGSTRCQKSINATLQYVMRKIGKDEAIEKALQDNAELVGEVAKLKQRLTDVGVFD